MEFKGYKVVVTKAVSQDEQLQMEVCADTPAGLKDRLASGLEILDARLMEQGRRVVEATQWLKQYPVAVQQAVNATIGILYGRPGAPQEAMVAAEAIAKMEEAKPKAAESGTVESAK
jgi:hypothetical protein